MQDTIPRTLTEAEAARARTCVLCGKPPGQPCRAKPEADHLARYLEAVVGELVVIHRAVMIPAVTS
jgi:hypothetical protein